MADKNSKKALAQYKEEDKLVQVNRWSTAGDDVFAEHRMLIVSAVAWMAREAYLKLLLNGVSGNNAFSIGSGYVKSKEDGT